MNKTLTQKNNAVVSAQRTEKKTKIAKFYKYIGSNNCLHNLFLGGQLPSILDSGIRHGHTIGDIFSEMNKG